ncbi:phage holin family protein [Paracoccus alkanivorans]|uniref:Phage holin family protein n=1 Tax=Paracoccus alkanivorans TaxID=2116655 RepID=A0A3M0LZR6_9RHOB|nr:phage holin family protein [Paracoccus alkanivorans]RMC31009.1 phage holin family protein [Paracoccus alkanivorans]
MFDYTRRLQLALGDALRRSTMKIVAGVVIAAGAGFLVAALWIWLAYGLEWGAALASLAIGGGFVVIGMFILLMAKNPRHPMPTTDELKREVDTHVNLAADAATERARNEAARVMGMAESKLFSLMGGAGKTARKAARGKQRLSAAANSNTGSMVKLLAAFAIGAVLASRLRRGRDEDDDPA